MKDKGTMSDEGLTVISLILGGICGLIGWEGEKELPIKALHAFFGFMVGFGLFGGILSGWFGGPTYGGYEHPYGESGSSAWPD
jgi:hypothetical protein